MSKNVLLGATERTKARNAINKESEIRRGAGGRRPPWASFSDLGALVKALMAGKRIDTDAMLELLHHQYYFGGLTKKAFPAVLFDPDLTDLARLPAGVLDEKKALLPEGLIPTTKEQLRAHCERMIVITRDKGLIEAVIRGWPAFGRTDDKMARHVDDLWQLHAHHPPLYRALVLGRHARVMAALRTAEYAGQRAGTSLGTDELARLRRALIAQTLIWCAHDIQLVLARNVLGALEPLGGMLTSDHDTLPPERVLNEARDLRAVLDKVLAAYRNHRMLGRDDREPNNDPVIAHPSVRQLHNLIIHEADQLGVNPDKAFQQLDEELDRITRRLEGANDEFLRQTALPKTSNKLGKSFHPLWYSGLSSVQASAVPIIRYVQAQACIEALLEAAVRSGARLTLPAYGRSVLPHGSKERIMDLLVLFRRELLKDKHAPVRAGPDDVRGKNTGAAAISRATDFLEGRNLIGAHQDSAQGEVRTYELLDIIPEHRLNS
ncbi:hypothetical protein ACSBM8_12365 [Sphingomonas sp. ASY06-1R]|uniref:hypothetical protein n=1 Tax=Sphingomonas sp. ASY06-1R TaxID=3445771 RepID=UPI003FA2E514